MNADDIAHALAHFQALCRQVGMPVTVQRRAVLLAVLERDDHPTADQVLEAVSARLPGISRTTVYRVLEKLTELGVLRRLQHGGSVARFDARLRRHHHLVCNRCQKVLDLNDERLDGLSIAHIHPKRFQIDDFSVHITGVCQDCRRAKAPRRR